MAKECIYLSKKKREKDEEVSGHIRQSPDNQDVDTLVSGKRVQMCLFQASVSRVINRGQNISVFVVQLHSTLTVCLCSFCRSNCYNAVLVRPTLTQRFISIILLTLGCV